MSLPTTTETRAQHRTPTLQQRAGTFRIPDRPFQVGDVLPGTCGVLVVAWVLGVTPSQVHRLRRQGKLNGFLLPAITKARYSGAKLQQWAEGRASESFIGGSLQRPRSFGRSVHV